MEMIKESFEGPNNSSWKLKYKQLHVKMMTMGNSISDLNKKN